jgi:hypothetical protein
MRAWRVVVGWELVLLVGAVALGIALRGSTGLTREIATAAAAAIENASPAEHHAHGHDITGGDRVICGVHVFGYEPATARTVAAVTTVYGYYFCAIGAPGTPYSQSSRSDGPVVVHFGSAPSVTIAAPGDGYADRVRAMMPDPYESQCFHGLPDSSVAAAVKSRYESP